MSKLAFILDQLLQSARQAGVEKLRTLPNGLHLEMYPDGSLLAWRTKARPSEMEIMILIRDMGHKIVDVGWQDDTAKLTPRLEQSKTS